MHLNTCVSKSTLLQFWNIIYIYGSNLFNAEIQLTLKCFLFTENDFCHRVHEQLKERVATGVASYGL